MGKGSHDPQAEEPAKLAARSLTMKRSASRDLLGDALDCAASCIDAAALDAYRLDYASFETASRYPDTSFPFVLAAATPSRRRRRVTGHGEPRRRPKPLRTHTNKCRPRRRVVAAMACPSTPSRRRAVAAMACREPLHHLHDSKPSQHAGIDWERCAARRGNSRRPTTTRPP